MNKKQKLIRGEIGHEIAGLVVVLGLVLGAVALRCALFLPPFLD